VGNKADVAGTEEASALLRERAEADGVKYFEVSAVTGKGMDPLILAVAEMVHELRKTAVHELAGDSHRVCTHGKAASKEFSVRNLGGGVFQVDGKGIERMVIMTEWNNEEAIAFLQKRLVKAGVERALEEAGAVDGDEIRIVGRSFHFESALARDPEVAFIEDDWAAGEDSEAGDA
jgi:GTP-binding protein